MRLLAPPVGFALRRLRARPLQVVGLVLALAAAAGLVGWSSVEAALAQETSVRLRLAERPPGARSFRVVAFTQPGAPDRRAEIERAFAGLRDVTAPARSVRVWHSIDPNDAAGTRLVTVRERDDLVLESGRRPHGCRGDVCEVVVLTGNEELGARVPLRRAATALVVGRGRLRTGILPSTTELGARALYVRSVGGPLAPLVRNDGSTVATAAPLRPLRVHAADLPRLRERLRRTIARLQRGDPLVRPGAPLSVLDELDRRGTVARRRLLLVAGEGAALIVAFAAFAAATRRRDRERAEEQLATFGASRAQIAVARAAEVALPAAAGTLLALGGLAVVSRAEGVAVPSETVWTIVGVAAAATVVLLAAGAPRRARFGLGALELTALTALALVAWQAAATGALDANRVAARGAGPLLLLVPALAFFAAGVLLLRLLPPLLRAAERLARRAPVAARLALVGAARSPAQAAAATTFLAVAVGASLFSLGYRTTLERQAADQARFAAGAPWRVVAPPAGDVTPLTRFAAPTPALRLDGDVLQAYPRGGQVPVRVLALPARRLPQLLGWRGGFARTSRGELASRLRPQPVRLHGPPLARDARALRAWARVRAGEPRIVVAHLLLPGQRFAHVVLGVATRRWRLLRAPVRDLPGAQLVGIEFASTSGSPTFQYDPRGYLELGPLEQLARGAWTPLPPLGSWREAQAADGATGYLAAWDFTHAPVERGIRFDFNGTLRALIHPKLGLPAPPPGFEVGAVPALAGPPAAAQAVDGTVTLDVAGRQLPVRIVGRARLFPTVLERPSRFLVLDYDTLFAALNGDRPGTALPNEAWFFTRRPAAATVDARALERRLRADPLAAGTESVLGLAGVLAAALALVGLVLASRAALADDRLALAEYEALGVQPRSLRRSAQLRLVAVSALGIGAGVLGAWATVRVVGALVAVAGTARRPLPPIVAAIAWPQAAAVLVAVGAAGVGAAAFLTARALRAPAARRLRA
ncbi:MAG TPA: hypothetical protein VGJ77_14665 [Gaiellaceae bacterium]